MVRPIRHTVRRRRNAEAFAVRYLRDEIVRIPRRVFNKDPRVPLLRDVRGGEHEAMRGGPQRGEEEEEVRELRQPSDS